MSRGSKFEAWFREQFPEHADAIATIDITASRRAESQAEKSLAMARSDIDRYGKAINAHDIALRSWVARRLK